MCLRIGEREYGLAVKIVTSCEICGDNAPVWSSPRVNSGKTCNPFVVNILATRAMKTTGNHQTALNEIFATMNVSGPGPSAKKRMAEKDRRRSTASARKRASAENMQRALKKRHLGDSKQKDYLPGTYREC